MSSRTNTLVSKQLSKVLRHQAEKLGLNVRADGYVPLDEVLALNVMKSLKVTREVVERVVRDNAKQRFSLLEEGGRVWVRANQGHSIASVKSESLLTLITDPSQHPACVHGSYLQAWQSIQRTGLSRMGRTHIHMSSQNYGSKEMISGMRGNCQVLVHVDMAAAMAAGIRFYVSSNQVILSEGQGGWIPTRFFSKVVAVRSGELLPFDRSPAGPAGPEGGLLPSPGGPGGEQGGGPGGQGVKQSAAEDDGGHVEAARPSSAGHSS